MFFWWGMPWGAVGKGPGQSVRDNVNLVALQYLRDGRRQPVFEGTAAAQAVCIDALSDLEQDDMILHGLCQVPPIPVMLDQPRRAVLVIINYCL